MIKRVLGDVNADKVYRGSPWKLLEVQIGRKQLLDPRLESNIDSLREFLKSKVETRYQKGVSSSDLTDIFLNQKKTSAEISDLYISLLLQAAPTLESAFKSFI